MSRGWVQVTIPSSVDAGELLGVMNDPYAQGSCQEENGLVRLYWPADQWSTRTLFRVKETLRIVTPDSDVPVDVQILPDQDWNMKWAELVRPIRIGRRIIIRPSWHTVEVDSEAIELIIDPKQAFGTGHHATTQLLVEWLEEIIRGGERVLDLGAGSGILSMVCLRLGTATALGVDHDAIAIDCAREYALLNGFGPELQLRVGGCEGLDWASTGSADIVLANLDRGTLLKLLPLLKYCFRKDAALLLSGILVEDRDEVAAILQQLWGIVPVLRERDGWLAMRATIPGLRAD